MADKMNDGGSDAKTSTHVSSRRQVIGGAVVGAAAVALSSEAGAKPVKQSKAKKPIDVVVIGGGFAGVTAARDMAHRGLNVVLLEARNRLGGRTFTTQFGNDPVEMGGTWVHWSQPNVWAEIMRYNLEIKDTQIAAPMLWMAQGKINKSTPLDYYLRLDALNRSYFADADKIVPRPYEHGFSAEAKACDAMSALDRLNQLKLKPDDFALLESVSSMYFMGSAAQGGYLSLVHEWVTGGADTVRVAEAAQRYKLKDGTISLINAIVADGGYEVRLSSPVAKVIQGSKDVEVVTQSGDVIQSKFVVVAVPVNTLNNIGFAPALSAEKQNMSREKHAGIGRKVWVRVKGRFEDAIGAPSDQPLSYAVPWSIGDDSTLLVAFSCNDDLDVDDPKAVQTFLAKFRPDVQVTETLSYDWLRDPYSLGVHCLFKKGQCMKYLSELQTSEGRLFFAGSDIAVGWRGYIDGAIETGARTAQKIVQASRS